MPQRSQRAILLAEPVLVQVEATVDQGIAVLAGIAGDHAGLTVGTLAERTTPLAGDTDRVSALLGKVAAVEDQDPRGSAAEGLGDQVLVLLQDALVVPGSIRDELLHALHIATFQRKRHRFDRLALKLEQLAVQVGESPLALFRALEEWGKVGMVGDQFIRERLDIAWSEVVLRGSARWGGTTDPAEITCPIDDLLRHILQDSDHLTL